MSVCVRVDAILGMGEGVGEGGCLCVRVAPLQLVLVVPRAPSAPSLA